MGQLLMNDEADSTSDDDAESLFDESDDTTDGEEWLFDDENRHPPEHYINAAANLDVARLRQKRYSTRTQERLDWVKEHCIQYDNMHIIFSSAPAPTNIVVLFLGIAPISAKI
jgi:hypothetical protein